MKKVLRSQKFNKWLNGLRDQKAKARIADRINRLKDGDYGDCKFFDGLGELRIFTGKGYRIYFVEQDETIIILLNGGHKDSQARDIKQAKLMMLDLKNEY